MPSPGPDVPAANRARIRMATTYLIACGTLLVASVVWAFLVPGPTIVLMTVSIAVTVALCALARVMWGWLETTPARSNAVRLARWAPFVAYALYGFALLMIGERPEPLLAYIAIPGLAAAFAGIAAAPRR
jgi:hypothetical protein